MLFLPLQRKRHRNLLSETTCGCGYSRNSIATSRSGFPAEVCRSRNFHTNARSRANEPGDPIHDAEPVSSLDVESSENIKRLSLFVLEADSPEALHNQVRELISYITHNSSEGMKFDLANLAYTLNQRISSSPFRIAVPANSTKGLLQALGAVTVQDMSRATSADMRLAYIFGGLNTGSGGEGKGLTMFPVYKKAIAEVDAELKILEAEWSIVDELSRPADPSQRRDARVIHCVFMAVQIGLVDLLKSWNVKPNVITGVSNGEIAAAYAIGALSLEECVAVAYHRGNAVAELSNRFPDLRGKLMLAISNTKDTSDILNQVHKEGRHRAGIAATYGPSATAVSGDTSAVEAFSSLAADKGIATKEYDLPGGYHSHHMSLVGEFYQQSLDSHDISPNPSADIEYFSPVTARLEPASSLGTAYWVNSLPSPVKFTETLTTMCAQRRVDCLVEINTNSRMRYGIEQTLAAAERKMSKPEYLPSLSAGGDHVLAVLQLAANLFVRGYPVDIEAVNDFSSFLRRPTGVETML